VTLSWRPLAALVCLVGGIVAPMHVASGAYVIVGVVMLGIGAGIVGGWVRASARVADQIVIGATLVLLGVTAVRWQIADAVTVIGLLGVEVIAGTFQVVALGLAIGVAIGRWRRSRWRAVRPLGIWAVGAALWFAVPWDDLNLAVVWRARHAGFEEVVGLVRRGQLTGYGQTDLPSQYRSLSSDGQVWICGSGDSATVMFYTFVGVLSHFSGFVHVNPDVPPSGDCFRADRVQVVKRAPNWYYVASY
jgi:hypothetical protein